MNLLNRHISKTTYYIIIFAMGYAFGFVSAVLFWNTPLPQASAQSAYYGFIGVVSTFVGIELGRRTRKR